MSRLTAWDALDFKNGGKGGANQMNDKYLRLKPGNAYRVRPVGKPITFWCYYVASQTEPNRSNRAITSDPENCVIHQKYNQEPKKRFAVNVIDRVDGRLKVMEAPPSVFERIKEWAKASGHNPGGSEGADFEIKVVLPANGDKKRTEYVTTPIVQTPFTNDEKEMIKSKGPYDLEKEFAPTPQSEIEAKLYPVSSGATTAKAASPVAVAAKSDDNDLGF